jgi:homospermidine synthase
MPWRDLGGHARKSFPRPQSISKAIAIDPKSTPGILADLAIRHITVKFEGEKLPAILNAIVTENNGQKLVLEVSVRAL